MAQPETLAFAGSSPSSPSSSLLVKKKKTFLPAFRSSTIGLQSQRAARGPSSTSPHWHCTRDVDLKHHIFKIKSEREEQEA